MKLQFHSDKCYVITREVIEVSTHVPYKQARELIKWKDKDKILTPLDQLKDRHITWIVKMLLKRNATSYCEGRTYQDWYDLMKKEQRFRLLKRRYNSFIEEFLDEQIEDPIITNTK